MRAKLASLLGLRHEVEGFAAALNSLAARYHPTAADATDFGAELASEGTGRRCAAWCSRGSGPLPQRASAACALPRCARSRDAR
jgi:hypothetical protein